MEHCQKYSSELTVYKGKQGEPETNLWQQRYDGMTTKLKAAQEVRTWHCKISRIIDGTSEEAVRQYVQELNVMPIKIEALLRHGDAPIYIHLVIPYGDKDTVMQDKVWPSGIQISGWHFARRNHREGQQQRNE